MFSDGNVDKFQIDYQTHIQQLKNQQMELEQLKDNDLNNTNEGLGAACLPDSTPQKYIDELTTTYQRTTTALQKASHRVHDVLASFPSFSLGRISSSSTEDVFTEVVASLTVG